MECKGSGEHIHPSSTHTSGDFTYFYRLETKEECLSCGGTTPILLACFMGIGAPSDIQCCEDIKTSSASIFGSDQTCWLCDTNSLEHLLLKSQLCVSVEAGMSGDSVILSLPFTF